MNKTLTFTVFFLLSALATFRSSAQTAATMPTYKVAIFAPLYLDSVFDEKSNFKYRQGIPRFAMPGLEFVQGAQVALDSMSVWDNNIDAYIYDAKSTTDPIPNLIKTKKLDSMNLIIGSVKEPELSQLADFARDKKIPFISATYPNDAGITNNPFFVIVNSTLKSHCEAIYSFIFQIHGGDKVVLCRKNGSQENKVAEYFSNINEQDGQSLVTIQTLNFDSTIDTQMLISKLDSNRENVVIGGSLDEVFATNLAQACYDLSDTYSITLLGMPNWDGFGDFYKKDNFKNFPIYYTTPYFNNKQNRYSQMVKNAFSKKYKATPTDMAYKGFETTHMFIKLLTKYPDDYRDHLNDTTYTIFNEYNFKKISQRGRKSKPDYIENKHVYFIQILNGAASIAW